jgi:hypothetical protein
MFCCLFPAGKKKASLAILVRTILQCAGLIAILCALLLFNACSGASVPGSANTAPTTNSDTGLTISATLPAATVGSIT